MNPRHLTADLTYQEDVEKVRRYTFMDKMSDSFGMANRRGFVDGEFNFPGSYNGLFSVKYGLDESKIIAGFGTGQIQVLDSNDGEVLQVVREAPKRAAPIVCVRCVPNTIDESFFAAGLEGSIYKCMCEDGACELFAEEKQNEINSIDINGRSEFLVSAGKDAVIRMYDIETGKLRKKWFKQDRFNEASSTTRFHTMRIFCVKFHDTENNMFLSGGWDDTVKIWDVRTKESCVKNIIGPHICGEALDVKDKRVLTGSWTVDNSIQLWDLGSSNLIANVNPINRMQTLDGEFLYCCQFLKCSLHPDIILAGGSGTGHLELISIPEEKVLNAFKAQKVIQAIDSTKNAHIVFGGMEPVIRIIRF